MCKYQGSQIIPVNAAVPHVTPSAACIRCPGEFAMKMEWGQERKESMDLTVGMSLIMALPPIAFSNNSEEWECYQGEHKVEYFPTWTNSSLIINE